MGIRYSIDLYFPSDMLEAALSATAAIAGPAKGASTKVTLPSGRTMHLPFTSQFKTDPVNIRRRGDGVELDISLLFPADEAVREYLADRWQDRARLVNGIEYAEIGYIYLTVRAGCRFAELSYTAATSGMSRLFVESRAVQGRFLDLLRQANGLAGVIDVEEYPYLRLDDPSATVEPDFTAWEAVPDKRLSVDATAACMCDALGRQIHRPAIGPDVLAWNDRLVVRLARVIHEEKRWSDLPILGDALLDAGCCDDEVVGHCRAGGEHAWGCWVTDILLRRSY